MDKTLEERIVELEKNMGTVADSLDKISQALADVTTILGRISQ